MINGKLKKVYSILNIFFNTGCRVYIIEAHFRNLNFIKFNYAQISYLFVQPKYKKPLNLSSGQFS